MLWLGLFMVLFQACGGAGPKACSHQPPEPIFKGIEGLENHEFERTGNDALERVDIPDPAFNLSIELYQSGCDALRQEFRIIVHEPYEVDTPAPLCAAHVANIFRMLAEKHAVRLGPLHNWAQLILDNAQRMVYNEPVPIPEGGVYLQIDKVHQTKGAILTLVIAQ